MLHRLIRYSCIFAVHMSPGLNRSFVLQRFEHSNMVELCNRIMFDFYLGPATYSIQVHIFFIILINSHIPRPPPLFVLCLHSV